MSATDERILLSPPDVGEAEREALLRAFDSGWIAPLGADVDAFEAELAEYTGAESCVVLSSGTAALQLGLIAVGVEPGDEVVVQSATFAASAFAVVHAGGIPVFIDSDWDTWNMDPGLLEELLEKRARAGKLPKAVMPVDLYGMLADYDRIEPICRRFGVAVVSDATEALGSRGQGRLAGAFGECAALSFNGNKIITTSGGGALLGPAELTSRVRHLATQAREPGLHYEHVEIGYNARMSNLLAGLGRAQLAGLEPRLARRGEIARTYRSEFPNIDWVPDAFTRRPNHWMSVGLLPVGLSPFDICKTFAQANIEVRPAWKPMHQQPVFIGNEMLGGQIADDVFTRGICLPSGSGLSDGQVDRVVELLHSRLGSLTDLSETER